MALPPNNNDLQRAKVRELNKIASFSSIIKTGSSFANNSRDNVIPPAASPTPTLTPTPTITITPTVTPSITITPTISISPTQTPTITVTSSQTQTPSLTISLTPSVTPTLTLTPSITLTNTITPSITPTITYMPPALVVTTISGVSSSFFNYLGLSGTYLRRGYYYPGSFFKTGTRQSASCEITWYGENDLYTGSLPGYLIEALYDDTDPESSITYFWGAGYSYYPSNSTYPPEPLSRDLPPSGRYFPLSAPQNELFEYLLRDPSLCLNVDYNYTPLTPTPTPTVSPTISLTPTITPTITLTISVTPSVTPTISITPSITPTISLTPSITPTRAPSTTIYVSGDADFFAEFSSIPGQNAFVMFTDGATFNSKPYYSYVGEYQDIIQMYWRADNRWVLDYQSSIFISNNTDSYYPPFKYTYEDAQGWSVYAPNSAIFGAKPSTLSSLAILNYLTFPTPTPTPSRTPGFTAETLYQAYSIPLTFTYSGLSYNIQQVGSSNPTLTAYRGQNYDFVTTYLSSAHPLALRLASGNTSPVSGTYNNYPSTGLSDGGVILFTPDINTPDQIIYQCTVHSAMSGIIVIKSRLYSPYDLTTPTPTLSLTPSITPPITPSVTPTKTVTPTVTRTPTITPTISPTIGSILDGVKSINVFYTNGVGVSTVPAGYWRDDGTVYTAVCANINNDYFYLIFGPNLSPLSGSDRWCFVQDDGVTEYPRAMFDSFDRTHIPSTTGWRFIDYPGAKGSQANFSTLRISLCSETGTPY